jgi:hypothetical protein
MMPKIKMYKLCGLLLGALVFVSTSRATAQYTEQRFMLGFSYGLFEIDSKTFSTEYEPIAATSTTFENDTATKVSFGILPSLLGIDMGYSVSGLLVLGCNLQLSYANSEGAGGIGLPAGMNISSSVTTVGFIPHADFVFADGQITRPFIGVSGGLQFVSASTDIDYGYSGDSSGLSFLVGARGGIHIFVAGPVSITPTASFMAGIGSFDDSEDDFSILLFDIFLGLTVWL